MFCTNGTCGKLYGAHVKLMNSLQDFFLLFLRAYFGWQFFMAGKGKLMNIEQTTGFFQNINIPFPEAHVYLVGVVECLGGLMLLVGFMSRIVTVPLVITMIVAFLTAHHEALSKAFSDPKEFITQAAFSFLMACLTVLFFGPGKFSLDRIFCKKSGCQM